MDVFHSYVSYTVDKIFRLIFAKKTVYQNVKSRKHVGMPKAISHDTRISQSNRDNHDCIHTYLMISFSRITKTDNELWQLRKRWWFLNIFSESAQENQCIIGYASPHNRNNCLLIKIQDGALLRVVCWKMFFKVERGANCAKVPTDADASTNYSPYNPHKTTGSVDIVWSICLAVMKINELRVLTMNNF